MRADDELTGSYAEPPAGNRVVGWTVLGLLVALYAAFPVALITGEVLNALDGKFGSFGLCSAVSLVMLWGGARVLWRAGVWEPPRRVRRFRYAAGVLEYETRRHGARVLPLAQVRGVYAWRAKGGWVFRWSVRRADGEWLIVDGTTENGQELIDRLCRDGGWGEPGPAPV